ncbi:hypothetical protein [Desulfurobacterium indicum]|uniref:Type II secretion system protein GspN n=1 Tax=Desulfurobacterium indicum TaxID=1914305 RepID=A0A1R1MM29_9BACT|nr:hypothetical protein [Desulfurobacterium indicum]OMH40865.1 hypothetical protein BLW93_02825 [Desulfurobacterium indicum]
MKKILLVVLCIAVSVFSFFYFLPADVMFANYLSALNVKCSSVEGNGLHMSLSDLEFKGVSVKGVDIVNKILSLDIISGRSKVSIFPFSKKIEVSLKRFPVSLKTYGFEAEGYLNSEGFVKFDLSGDLNGKINFERAVYKGINIGNLEGRFSYKNGNFSSDLISSPIRGRITGSVKEFKGKVIVKGVADLFVSGQKFSEKFYYELAGLR